MHYALSMSNETAPHPADPLLPDSPLQNLKRLLDAPRVINYHHQREEPPMFAPSEPSVAADVPCDDCGGTGIDVGGLNEYQPETCQHCQGSGKESMHRNYLAEAFAVAEGRSMMIAERKHLAALIDQLKIVTQKYCDLVSREAA